MEENTDLHIFMQSITNLKSLLKSKSNNIYAGDLPNKQLKKVFDWLAGNSDWAVDVFYELNPELL